MKITSQEDLNFFSSKIEKDENLLKKYIKNSLIVYIIIFCIAMTYFTINSMMIDASYKKIKKQVENIENVTIIGDSLRDGIDYQSALVKKLETFLKKNKVLSKMIETIHKIKPENVYIERFVWNVDSMKMQCNTKDEKEAIKFVHNIREKRQFKNIEYSGGTISEDGTFTFEINIML